MLAVATWNVNSLRVRLPQVLRWLEGRRPDVVSLQETKLPDDDFPRAEFEGLGYHVAHFGQKSYNGVALLSREPLEDVQRGMAAFPDDQARVLAATTFGIRCYSLYVPNGEALDSDKFDYKIAWLDGLALELEAALARHPRLLAMGDFNIAPEARDCYDPDLLEGGLFCSQPEREALQRLLDLGLTDCFRRLHPEPGHYTWWDYRGAAFRRNRGLRIDLILASRPLAETLTACDIDREPRAWPRPSDHAPVIARFRV